MLYNRSEKKRREIPAFVACSAKNKTTELHDASKNMLTFSCWKIEFYEYFSEMNLDFWISNISRRYEGSHSLQTVKYGHEFRGTRNSKWLCWRRPAAIVNDRLILTSERMLHKDYYHKSSNEKTFVMHLKGLDAKTNWLAVNRQSKSNSDSNSEGAEPREWEYNGVQRNTKEYNREYGNGS
jgi:hypothetical protein